jgi:hypothetical protein
MFDSCNEFMRSYNVSDEIKRGFLGPYLSYKSEKPGPIDEPAD